MKVLSIDVGVKNLALCCLSYDKLNLNIDLWESYDIYKTGNNIITCEGFKKNKEKCCKKASYIDKKTNYNSCKIHIVKTSVLKKNKKVYSLHETTRLIIQQLKKVYDEKLSNISIHTILIELQPRVNQKMKFVSHVIFTCLVNLFYDKDTKIKFITARKKLHFKYFNDEFTCKNNENFNLKNYKDRKKLSIVYTNWFVNKYSDEWCNFLNSVTKKDDLCDAFLMSLNEC